MTPTELLNEAKNRFIVLYHNDTGQLNLLLKQALGKYQEKAGSVGMVRMIEDNAGEIDAPANVLDLMTAVDANMKYHDCAMEGGKVTVDIRDDTTFPVDIHYFHNLRDWPLSSSLPNGVVGIAMEYLVALIDIPNTERERAIAASTGQQIELPSKQELKDKLTQIETEMEDARAIGIPMAVF